MKSGKLTAGILAAAMVVGSADTATVSAGSIWAKGTPRTQSLFADDSARNIGDVLTIIINERSRVQNDTSRDNEKKTLRSMQASGSIDNGVRRQGLARHTQNLPTVLGEISSDTKFEGDSSYETDRNMTDQITVTVHDVQPNGNLVVMGSRTREMAGDTQVIEVSGIVRPSDITYNNTVNSDQVAEFQIVHKTSGIDTRYTTPGWLTYVADLLNPF